MNKRIFTLLLLIHSCLLLCISTSHANDHILGAGLKPLGRTSVNLRQELELVSSGAHFGLSFKGTECRIYVTHADASGHNYLQYELDGVYQKRIRIEGNSASPVIIRAKGKGIHTLWIYKATEAHTGALKIAQVQAEEIKNIEIPKLPLIEFIGNSITCGAAADDSLVPCGTGVYHDQHNAYMAYGPRVARSLSANFILSSVSGIGVYRTWNRENPSLPMVYDQLDFQEGQTLKWDFSTYTPAVLSIALGTNDLSRGDGSPRAEFDTLRFVSTYVKFVTQLKSIYPNARIALLSSPMIKGNSAQLLERCLGRIKESIDADYPNDKPVSTFFFKPMDPHGCTGHPNVEDHGILAEQLKAFFYQLLH